MVLSGYVIVVPSYRGVEPRVVTPREGHPLYQTETAARNAALSRGGWAGQQRIAAAELHIQDELGQ